jgi:hypothetical protein
MDFSFTELSKISKTAGSEVSPRTVRKDLLIWVAPWTGVLFLGNLWYL